MLTEFISKILMDKIKKGYNDRRATQLIKFRSSLGFLNTDLHYSTTYARGSRNDNHMTRAPLHLTVDTDGKVALNPALPKGILLMKPRIEVGITDCGKQTL